MSCRYTALATGYWLLAVAAIFTGWFLAVYILDVPRPWPYCVLVPDRSLLLLLLLLMLLLLPPLSLPPPPSMGYSQMYAAWPGEGCGGEGGVAEVARHAKWGGQAGRWTF